MLESRHLCLVISLESIHSCSTSSKDNKQVEHHQVLATCHLILSRLNLVMMGKATSASEQADLALLRSRPDAQFWRKLHLGCAAHAAVFCNKPETSRAGLSQHKVHLASAAAV